MSGPALLLLLCCCWGRGQSGASGEEGRAAPLSQLRSQINNVEELLEEFRKQLQQQGEPELHRPQGEPQSPGHAPDLHRLQGASLSPGHAPDLHHLQGASLNPGHAPDLHRLQGASLSPGHAPDLHRLQGASLSPGHAPDLQGEPQSPGHAQGLHHLQGESWGPGEDEGVSQPHREPQNLEDAQAGIHTVDHHPHQRGDPQSPGEEQGLHHLQQLQDEAGCESRFTGMQDYIIRTNDSVAAGATFLMAPGGVLSWRQCLGACCAEPRCSTAVVELSAASGHPGEPTLSCYLFDCMYRGDSVCTFSLHRGYRSFTTSPDNASATRQREPTSNYQQSLTLTAEQDESDEPPRSNAGQDVVLQLPTDWVVLDGRESIDDHGIIRYEWNLLQGDTSVDMKVPQPGTIQLSHLQEGAYTLQLTVTDTAGQRSSDNITVTVLPKKRLGVGCTGSCSRYQFTCDDGCCIDITLACDRVVQCPDGSDEAFCQNFGPDRNTVTHAVESDAQQKTLGLTKAIGIDRQIENDQRINLGKQPLLSLDTDKSKQLITQEVNENEDRFIPEHCLAPSVVGPCKGLFPRWYFDVSSGTCMHFFYGGCKGNENNFLQEADCLSECVAIHGVVPKVTATESPSRTNARPDHGSSGIASEDKNDNGKNSSKGNFSGGGHPAPETGAVLPLALGLAITALLLLMVVCRLRLVRQKLKKARPMTSEESDYLINGMYL